MNPTGIRNIIRISIVALSCALSTIARAQTPVISWLNVDEPSRTLFIHGSAFGSSANLGAITVDSVRMTPVSWSDTLVTCLLPDSGRGYAGPVEVFENTIGSVERLLSDLRIHVYFTYSEDQSGPLIFLTADCDWRLSFRLDLDQADTEVIMKWQKLITPSRASVASYIYNGEDQADERDHYQTTLSIGSANLSWQRPDSLQQLAFWASAMQNDYRTVTLNSLGVTGSYTLYGTDTTIQFFKFDVPPETLVLDSSFSVVDTTRNDYPNGSGTMNPSFSGSTSFAPDTSHFLPPQIRSNLSVSSHSRNTFRVYPNPFVSSEIVQFNLYSPQHVQAQLFNPLGRKVLDIWNGIRDAGNNEIAFDTSTLPAGVYYCQIEYGGTRSVLKMVHTQ